MKQVNEWNTINPPSEVNVLESRITQTPFGKIKVGERFKTLDDIYYIKIKTEFFGCCSPQFNAIKENGEKVYFTTHTSVKRIVEKE